MPADAARPITETERRVRLGINRFFADEGFAPTAQDIAAVEKITISDAEKSFRSLHDLGHLRLRTGGPQLSSAHPYSAVPTAYFIESDRQGWWGNCAFCALGIAVIAGSPARIHCQLGAMQEKVTVEVDAAGISDENLRLHIPLPLRHWHDDVHFTCSNVHLFADSGAIDRWSERFLLPRGQDLPLANAWQFAKRWYQSYLDDDWVPHTADSLRTVCSSSGLVGDFWSSSAADNS